MARLDVLNPVAQMLEQSVAPARRRPDLSGKRIGLYWNMKGGGDVALGRTAELLQERFPGVTFVHYVGSVGFIMRHCTAEDADRIARECDAVVGTTAD